MRYSTRQALQESPMSDFPLSARLHELSATRRAQARPYIIGVGGSVAVGKSTFARALSETVAAWPEKPQILGLATDGFLLPNAILAARGLSLRKGFPESFDVVAMRAAIGAVRTGNPVEVPRYSHVTYDIDPSGPQRIDRPDILILDGLHLAAIEHYYETRLIDSLIFLDASEEVIESWFTARLLPLMVDGRDDPLSFYYAFRGMSDADRTAFAARVWREINLPNLRQHIVRDREAADFVVFLNPDHSVHSVTQR